MKFARLIPLAVIALCVSACGPQQIDTASTRAAIAADASYEAASKFGQDLVSLHKLDEAKFRELDGKAYTALLAVRAARATGAAPDRATATANLGIALAAIYSLKGD